MAVSRAGLSCTAADRTGLTARAAVATQPGPDGGTRITVLRSDGPLALRSTAGSVYLVGAAAGPVGGDDLDLEIDVGPCTRLVLRSAAASVLLPGPHKDASWLRIRARVAAGGRLDYCLQPTVAAAGCDHHATASVELEPGGVLRWREAIVLGRHGEPSGQCVTRIDVSMAGAPLYRGELAVGSPDIDGSSAVLDGAGAVGSVVLADAARAQPLPETRDGLAILPLAGPGSVVSAVAADAARLASLLDRGEQIADY
jgi:urease accessory protein